VTIDIHDPAFVAGVFDRCATGYRRWSAIASFGFVGLWRRQCVDALPDTTTQAPIVIDIMAGTGEIWPTLLARRPEIAKIIAIDISHQMHLMAMTRLHAARSGRIDHIEADFLTNDLPAGFADCAISTFGLKTLSPAQQVTFAQQLAGILRPGGVFSLVEASDPKGWLLRPIYRLYLDRILPMVERVFLNGAQDFSMLGIYTHSFQNISLVARRVFRVADRWRRKTCRRATPGLLPEETSP
jgi:ubiquinone/menaquinone biosynthesis C-methylase UbiE